MAKNYMDDAKKAGYGPDYSGDKQISNVRSKNPVTMKRESMKTMNGDLMKKKGKKK